MAIETGTVQFEKYNSGKTYRTAFFTYSFSGGDTNSDEDTFYTINNTLMTDDSGKEGSNQYKLKFSKMYKGDKVPTKLCRIRSVEFYVDTTAKDDGADGSFSIVTRMAKIADKNVEKDEMTGYDFKIKTTKILPINTDETNYFYINPNTNLFDSKDSVIEFLYSNITFYGIRVVFVCEEEV